MTKLYQLEYMKIWNQNISDWLCHRGFAWRAYCNDANIIIDTDTPDIRPYSNLQELFFSLNCKCSRPKEGQVNHLCVHVREWHGVGGDGSDGLDIGRCAACSLGLHCAVSIRDRHAGLWADLSELPSDGDASARRGDQWTDGQREARHSVVDVEGVGVAQWCWT